MTEYTCVLCAAPMTAQCQPALMPGRPDKVLLHCTSRDCDLCCQEEDLPLLDVALYASAARTAGGTVLASERRTP